MNITTAPKLTRNYPAARQWTDAHLGDRLATLHRRLILTADRHSEFVSGRSRRSLGQNAQII